MPSDTTTKHRRAIGIVRVSRIDEDDANDVVSPGEQRRRIEAACKRDKLKLVDVIEELNVSGGTPLAARAGLLRAVETVEAGSADVIVVAYFDRLVRSLAIQAEIVSRVEQAGGQILAVDVGQITNGSAAQWLSGTFLGGVNEYHRRVTAERTVEAKRRAVARGVAPFANLPPGYRRGDAGQIEPDPETAPVVAAAFAARAGGATVSEVREQLRAHGIERSFHGVVSLLKSRIMLGELHFGADVNLVSHPPIVDAAVWRQVQRMRSPSGRRAKSARLLARLGVLRCATCNGRMVVGSTTQKGKRYPLYRCNPINDTCTQRATISAALVEPVVVDAVREMLEGMRGTATVADGLSDAERALALQEQELDAAVRAFTGLEDVDAARDRLLELREQRDRARDRLAELQAAEAPAVTISGSGDWNLLTLDEQRALIVAVVDRVTVAPGRGAGRVTVRPRGQ
jgi:DNA invertase Pin-like site-specific DNA recombinase